MPSLAQPLLKLCICAPSSVVEAREPRQQFVQAVKRAFEGGADDGSYLASGPDLTVEVRTYASAPQNGPQLELDCAIHTLVVTFLNAELLRDEAFCRWLESCLEHVQQSSGRHGFLGFAQEETNIEQLGQSRLNGAQWCPLYKLGEPAIRPAHLALIALNEARRQIARNVAGERREYLDLFISHAKQDGLPLAQALRNQLASIPYATAFYDDSSLLFADDWKRKLESGVASSVTVLLRTDGFDESHYCRTEAIWADQYGCPALVVDARRGLSHHPGQFDMPVDNLPSVRVPDGNILRILNAAVREGLRAILLTRRVDLLKAEGLLPADGTWVIHRPPSIRALRHACEQLAANVASDSTVVPVVVYPGPKSPEHETLLALLRVFLPSGWLVTPETVAQLEEVGP